MSVAVLLLAFITKRRYALFLSISLILLAVAIPISIELAFIGKRLASHAVVVSDNIRIHELHYLTAYFLKSPIFGHGLGAYVPNHIRDSHSKFSYELQWIAFLMQTGVIGVSFLLFAVATIAKPFAGIKIRREQLSLFLLYVLWILSSLFNAYLTSSASAVIFAFFVSEGFRINRVVSGYNRI